LFAGAPVGVVGDFIVAVSASRSGVPGVRRAGASVDTGLGPPERLRQRPAVAGAGAGGGQGARAGAAAGAASGGADTATRQARALSLLENAENARNEAIEHRDRAKLNAERADKAAREIERQRGEDGNLREEAVVATKLAEQARDDAVKARGEAERKLVRLYAG